MSTELRDTSITLHDEHPPPRVIEPTTLPMLDSRQPLVAVADTVVLLGVMFLSLFVRFGADWPKSFGTYLAGFAIATAIHVAVAYFGGLYEPEPRLAARGFLPRVAALTATAILIDGAFALATGWYLMPRGNFPIVALLAVAGMTANRHLARRIRVRREGRPRILVVGPNDDAELVIMHLRVLERSLAITGHTEAVDDLLAEVGRTRATDVLLLPSDTLDRIFPHPLEELEAHRIGVFQRIGPSDTLLGLQRSRQIAGMPFVVVGEHALPDCRAHFKRLLDLIYLAVALPFLLLLVPLVALYIRLRAGRSIIHRQERVGRFGEPFTLYKFRTMVADAEAHTGPVLSSGDDPRIIPGLRWVRRTRLDEIPQFFNVARGQMAIVGPRPERPEFTAEYEVIIPGYGRRHDIPPGITGLAQVQGDYDTDPLFKLGHDLQYLVNWSPILDVQIILQTVLVVLRGLPQRAGHP